MERVVLGDVQVCFFEVQSMTYTTTVAQTGADYYLLRMTAAIWTGQAGKRGKRGKRSQTSSIPVGATTHELGQLQRNASPF